jgi:hypothetical protein
LTYFFPEGLGVDCPSEKLENPAALRVRPDQGVKTSIAEILNGTYRFYNVERLLLVKYSGHFSF